jgi:hypothetical protein
MATDTVYTKSPSQIVGRVYWKCRRTILGDGNWSQLPFSTSFVMLPGAMAHVHLIGQYNTWPSADGMVGLNEFPLKMRGLWGRKEFATQVSQLERKVCLSSWGPTFWLVDQTAGVTSPGATGFYLGVSSLFFRSIPKPQHSGLRLALVFPT